MPVNSVNNNAAYTTYTKAADAAANKAVAPETKATAEPAIEAETAPVTFTKSQNEAKVGYDKPNKLTRQQIAKLESMREESLRNMVTQLLTQQANGYGKKKTNAVQLPTLQLDLNTQPEVDTEDFYGVDATATRIMDMAMSLSGGDTSKIDTLKNAVIKGFEQAGAAFGKKLPDVCNQTYDEIMKRFDHWEKNGSLDGYTYTAATQE